jgi:hypothetical protein
LERAATGHSLYWQVMRTHSSSSSWLCAQHARQSYSPRELAALLLSSAISSAERRRASYLHRWSQQVRLILPEFPEPFLRLLEQCRGCRTLAQYGTNLSLINPDIKHAPRRDMSTSAPTVRELFLSSPLIRVHGLFRDGFCFERRIIRSCRLNVLGLGAVPQSPRRLDHHGFHHIAFSVG